MFMDRSYQLVQGLTKVTIVSSIIIWIVLINWGRLLTVSHHGRIIVAGIKVRILILGVDLLHVEARRRMSMQASRWVVVVLVKFVRQIQTMKSRLAGYVQDRAVRGPRDTLAFSKPRGDWLLRLSGGRVPSLGGNMLQGGLRKLLL